VINTDRTIIHIVRTWAIIR